MGILRNGLLGGVSGKVGNLVSYRLLGKEVVRLKGVIKAAPSEKQMMGRHDMCLVNAFLRPIQDFIKVGFAAAAKKDKMYPHNKAVSHHIKHALSGEYPNRSIDFSKVKLSKGNLPPLPISVVDLTAEGVRIEWTDNHGTHWGHRSDQVMLLAYFPEAEPVTAHYSLNAARRFDGSCLLALPPSLSDHVIEVFVALSRENKKQVSDSQYLGRYLWKADRS